MKRALIILAVVVALWGAWEIARRHIPSYIDYQGQKIKLTKFYLSYEDYKDDPDNLDPSEYAHVQQLVSSAPIARSFSDRRAAVEAVSEITFPGYGAGGFGGDIQRTEGSLNGLCVEIPRTDKSRYFIFRNVHGTYLLVDDFIESGASAIETMREEKGKLIYYTASGEPKLTHTILN